MKKSRARNFIENVLEDANPLQDGPTGSPAAAPVDPGAASPQAAGDPQPSTNNTPAPDLQQLVEDHASQPDGMAGMLKAQSDMMGRYLDEADGDVYSPENPEDQKACQDAQLAMNQAYESMSKVGRKGY